MWAKMVQLNWEISRLASTLRYKDFLLRNVPHTCPFQVDHSFQHVVSTLLWTRPDVVPMPFVAQEQGGNV